LKHGDVKRKDAAVRCLEALTTTAPHYWKPLLDAGLQVFLEELLLAFVFSYVCCLVEQQSFDLERQYSL
jgi:hypothetical protein